MSTARILEAAERLFSERGFAQTTMQDIVADAGTSIGNLYFYFENKDQLLQALVENALAEAHRRGDELAARVAPGPARMAVVMFSNASVLLAPGSRLLAILKQTSGNVLADHVATRNSDRIRRYMADNLPQLDPALLDYASRVWTGAGRGAIEAHTRQSELDLWDTAEFAVRWNLRGVGVPENQIDEAVAVARRIHNAT
ncbi:MAG: helix-turn-helix domain-containing protein [Gemmatimonadota bacterium]